jgi:hypothetical protein
MVSIHCAPLLAAILLLIPAALAQSVASGQTFLDTPLGSEVTLPSLGGQLTNGVDMAFAVAGDKAPNTVNTGAVTVGFTTANAVPINGQITLTVPKGYFSNVDSTKVNTFTGTSSTCKCVLSAGTATTDVLTCTVAGAPLVVGAVTLSIAAGALTTGAPCVAGTYNVQTTVDRAFTTGLPAVPQIGGVISDVKTFTLAVSDRKPGKLNADDVAITFTVAFPIPIGGKLTLSFPKNYLSVVSTSVVNTFAGKTTATCVLNKATTSAATVDNVVCTTAVDVLSAGEQTLKFKAGAITTSTKPVAATTGSATAGIKVSSSTDRESASGTSTVIIGDIIAVDCGYEPVGTTFVPSGPSAADIELKFHPKTGLAVGDKISIALPPKYFVSVDATTRTAYTAAAGTTEAGKAKCELIGGVKGTSVLDLIANGDTLICTVESAFTANTEVFLRFASASVTYGPPTQSPKYTFATSLDAPKATLASARNLPDIGKIFVAAPALTPTTAVVPGLSTANLEFAFVPVSALVSGDQITIALPSKFFVAVDTTTRVINTVAGGTTQAGTVKCVLTAGMKGTTVLHVDDADTMICTLQTALAAGGTPHLLFAIGTATYGGPQAQGKFNVATSQDAAFDVSGGAANAVAIGATIIADTSNMVIATADKVPFNVNTAAITVGFKVVTALPKGGKISITLPRGYFSKVDESKINTLTTPAGTTCTCSLTQATGVEKFDTVVCTTSGTLTGATGGQSQTLTFVVGAVTTGSATAAATTTDAAKMTISTSGDLPLSAEVPALGAVITGGVDLAFTNADDKIPGKFSSNNNTITLGFTSVTTIPIGGKITITLPQNYFSKVDNTKDNTIGATATAKCALANAQSSVPATIDSSATTVSTSTTLTVNVVPSVITGVTQIAIPLPGFSLDTSSVASCTANCVSGSKVTAALTNGVLTLTLSAESALSLKNTLTTFTVTLVTTPASAGWTTTGITGTAFNPFTTVVCTTAGAALPTLTTGYTFTFVAGSVTIGTGQKAAKYTLETSGDLPIAIANAKSTVALGGGLTGGKALAFANAQDAIPGKVNSGPISLGANLATSVPIGGQFLLTFPSNYFTAVNPSSVVTLTKGTRRSLLQTSTLSCVRTAGATVDQITCTLAGAASGTGAVVLTFPAGSLTTGLPTTTSGGFNLATANPPAAGAARVPYFPKAAGSAYGVASLLVALSALLACL